MRYLRPQMAVRTYGLVGIALYIERIVRRTSWVAFQSMTARFFELIAATTGFEVTRRMCEALSGAQTAAADN